MAVANRGSRAVSCPSHWSARHFPFLSRACPPPPPEPPPLPVFDQSWPPAAGPEHVGEPAFLARPEVALFVEVVLEEAGHRIDRLVADDAVGRLERRVAELLRDRRRVGDA